MSKSFWGVVLSVFFAVAIQITPVPDGLRPVLVTIAWTAVILSAIAWLVTHFDFAKSQRSPSAKTKPMMIVIVGLCGAGLAIGMWLLIGQTTGHEPPVTL